MAQFFFDSQCSSSSISCTIQKNKYKKVVQNTKNISACSKYKNLVQWICFIDHRQNGVIYNFSGVCLCVCMFVSVCNALTFESLDIESSISFVYKGHRVEVKVTRKKVIQNPYSCNVKLRSAITPVLWNIEPWSLHAAWGFSYGKSIGVVAAMLYFSRKCPDVVLTVI